MSSKFGEHNYDLERFMQRGVHEFANALYPESKFPSGITAAFMAAVSIATSSRHRRTER